MCHVVIIIATYRWHGVPNCFADGAGGCAAPPQLARYRGGSGRRLRFGRCSAFPMGKTAPGMGGPDDVLMREGRLRAPRGVVVRCNLPQLAWLGMLRRAYGLERYCDDRHRSLQVGS